MGILLKPQKELERSCTFYEHLYKYIPKEVLAPILVKFTHDMKDVLATCRNPTLG
jgi:hypothetical protein